MGINCVFLDVDGVLNTEFTTDHCGRYIGIEDRFVENLRKIVDSADNVKIVLSSTWRLGYNRYGMSLENNRKYLDDKLAKQGLEIFDVTEDLSRHGEARGHEISKWLEDHKDLNIEHWVVLDDEFFYDFQYYGIIPHWVQTWFYSEKGGLNDAAVDEAIRVLRGEDIDADTE